MELSKQDVVSLIGVIKTTYINCYKDVDRADLDLMAKTWYDILKEYSKELVGVAFKKCLQVCKFAPTLADIIEQIKLIENAGEPTENEYWAEIEQAVVKAQRVFYFGSRPYFTNEGIVKPLEKIQELFNGLSPIVREYLGSWQTLKSLSEYDTLEFEKNRFLKLVPNLKVRCEIKQTVDPNIIRLENVKLKIDNKKI